MGHVVKTYTKGFGPGRKEESWVGTPGERCSNCAFGTDIPASRLKGGEVSCGKGGGKRTRGSALCPLFGKRK